MTQNLHLDLSYGVKEMLLQKFQLGWLVSKFEFWIDILTVAINCCDWIIFKPIISQKQWLV